MSLVRGLLGHQSIVLSFCLGTYSSFRSFYNLAAIPDLVSTLREEVEEILASTCGMITATAIQRMVKLDSFLKEIMRYYPQSASKTYFLLYNLLD